VGDSKSHGAIERSASVESRPGLMLARFQVPGGSFGRGSPGQYSSRSKHWPEDALTRAIERAALDNVGPL